MKVQYAEEFGGGSKHELEGILCMHALYNYVMPASCACDDTAIFLPLL